MAANRRKIYFLFRVNIFNRPFAEHGHVTLSIIKIGGSANSCQKWKERDEISKVANFETAVV